MGLVTGIVTFPLLPVRGAGWVLDQVLTAAEQEYYDPQRVRTELADLERALTGGQISEEEYDRREDELLDQLEEIETFWEQNRGRL